MKRFVDKESQADARREFVSELVHYDSVRWQAKIDAEEKAAKADAKAKPNETWQALYEEGEEQGDRDAANGVRELYATALKIAEIHLQPWWDGYLKGYTSVDQAAERKK
jgi:hypothetical protein